LVTTEIEFRREPETDNSAEIQASVSNAYEGGLGATGPTTAEKPPEIAETVSTSHTVVSLNPTFQSRYRSFIKVVQ